MGEKFLAAFGIAVAVVVAASAFHASVPTIRIVANVIDSFRIRFSCFLVSVFSGFSSPTLRLFVFDVIRPQIGGVEFSMILASSAARHSATAWVKCVVPIMTASTSRAAGMRAAVRSGSASACDATHATSSAFSSTNTLLNGMSYPNARGPTCCSPFAVRIRHALLKHERRAHCGQHATRSSSARSSGSRSSTRPPLS
jgi:hypothetical protein